MIQGFGHALAAEAVEAPEQHHVEAPLVGIEKQLLKRGALGGTAAFLVAVLLIDGVAQPLGKGPQLVELVVVGLALVAGADAGVEGSCHLTKYVWVITIFNEKLPWLVKFSMSTISHVI